MPRKDKNLNQQLGEGKVLAILAYLPFFCIIPLLFRRDNPFVLSHGKQGLVIFVGEIGVFIVHIILGVWILKFGMFILLVLSFVGIIAVLTGRTIELPVISKIADKITL